jgi:hypothetical protein
MIFISNNSMSQLSLEEEDAQDKIFAWFYVNNLVPNQDQTQTMVFSLRELDISDEPGTVLGVYLDSELSWEFLHLQSMTFPSLSRVHIFLSTRYMFLKK